MPLRRSTGDPLLEVQIHLSDIRRGVWYLFLGRRQVLVGAGILLLLATFVLFNLAIAPRVVRDLLSRHEYRALTAERSRQGERLQSLTDRLTELGSQSEHLRMRMNRIFLAYGLSADVSGSQGGYPFPSVEVPESIYAGLIRHGLALEGQIGEQLRVLDAFIDEVQSFEEAHQDQVRSTPSLSPLRGSEFVLTSPFGTRRSPFTKAIAFHAGIDLAAPIGTPIHAPADGVVVFAGRYPLRQSVAWWRYGNLVALRNGDGFITLFGHCDEIRVRPGQRVEQGQEIATVGNSGWSTSPHLHYEVRMLEEEGGSFQPVDPRIYILDHRWRDEERLLVRSRTAPDPTGFEPLPRLIAR